MTERPRAVADPVRTMAEAFRTAAASDSESPLESLYALGGGQAEVRIAGRQLAGRITRAFSHLEASERGGALPSLTIHLWDNRETGVPAPFRYLRDAFHRTWPFGRMVLASSRDESVIGLQSHEAATVLDRRAGQIVGCVSAHDRLSLFELGKPLQPLLFAWHSDHDVVPIHAGLVARGGDGVLLGGAGGSGKSTTSLMCAHGGFDYLGDDYIGLPPANGGGEFQAHSFYNSTWLTPEHLRRFPWLGPHRLEGTPEDDKKLVLLSDVFPDRLARQATVRALALPRVAGSPGTTFRRASSAEAVLRLAPSSILQLPFISAPHALERVTELAHRVPSYWLDLGRDLEEIPRRVDELLADAMSH